MNKWLIGITSAVLLSFAAWVATSIVELKGFANYGERFTSEQGARLEERTKALEMHNMENANRLLRIEQKLDRIIEQKLFSNQVP